MINKHFVRLNEADNVFVCCKQIVSGTSENMEDVTVTFTTNIYVGHKVARRAIARGEKIIKYGVPIGSATENIALGEHVHLHNMKSDYIASYTRQNRVGEKP